MPQSQSRSVAAIQRDSDATRAELAESMAELRSKVGQARPRAVRAAAGDYLRLRGEKLVALARENPLQAAAIGAGLVLPALRVARAIPAPVLMIGAGLFLMNSGAGRNVSRAIAAGAADVADRVGDGADRARRTLHDGRDFAAGRVEAARDAVSAGIDSSRRAAADAAERISDAVSSLASGGPARGAATWPEGIGVQGASGAEASSGGPGGVEAVTASLRERSAELAGSARDAAAQAVADTTAGARDLVQNQPLLVGAVGLALGAFVAARLPRSDFESRVMGQTSEALQERAAELAAEAIETARDATERAYDAAAERIEEEGLGASAAESAVRDVGRKIGRVAEAATTAARELAEEQAH